MHPPKMPIYQVEQIRQLEQLALERFGLTSEALMQRAGKAAFDYLHRRWPQALKIAVFCGKGNNGGDGYVTALLAHERGLQVTIWQVGMHDNLQGEAKKAHDACVAAQMTIYSLEPDSDLGHPDLIIDAICGIGLHDDLREEVIRIIERIQHLHLPILALDIPTGIDADTGKLQGAALQATATVTFIGNKIGLLTGQGIAYAGEVIISDLHLPAELFSYVTPIAEKIQLSQYANYLKPRVRDWHKGLSGHVLVIGGDVGYAGAVRMAAQAALRVGAGLVSVATRPEHANFININYPEIMCHGVDHAEKLQNLLERADVVIIGPGLGLSDWSKVMWHSVMQYPGLQLVVDADGLNLLAQENATNENWILTPHPGEAARLLKTEVTAIQQDRLHAARNIQHQFGGACILKAAGTIVYARNKLPGICDKGNPGMATAGMGDILSGVVAGLLSQGIPASDAAGLGVCLHAAAGDLAAKEGERGMIATDLLPYLRRLSNHMV